jgi:hypothetical protein
MTLRSVSYGGGVQSTSLLVLAAEGKIDFPLFLFANVGDDSEDPLTLEYVRNVAMPYAADHGIELHELQRHRKDGSVETLWGRLTREGSRSLPIPVRMANGAPGTRSCTADFKIRVLSRWLRLHGATKDDPATVAVGISVDEMERASNRRLERNEVVVYPLLELGLRRSDCMRVIQVAGLPVPPKSSCFFCPLHHVQVFRDMRRERPELFGRAVQLERMLNERRDALGKDHVFLMRYGRPLDETVTADIQQVFDFGDEGACDSGFCFT